MEVLFLVIVICLLAVGTFIKVVVFEGANKRRSQLVQNFPSYLTVLNYYTDRAYEMIHKDRMLIYSLEATKINNEQFNQCAKDFATLTTSLMGPTLCKEFISLFGDEDTLLFNLVEFFNTKYESDEIRKASIENLMEENETEEK